MGNYGNITSQSLIPLPPIPSSTSRSFFDSSAVTAQNNEKYKIETYRPTKPSNNEKSIILSHLNS